jgi:hypothetical protein
MRSSNEPDVDGSQSLSPPSIGLPPSSHPLDNPPQSSRVSRSGDITSKPKNQSLNNNELMDVRSNRGLAASGPSSEGRPSPEALIRKHFQTSLSTQPQAVALQQLRVKIRGRGTLIPWKIEQSAFQWQPQAAIK